MKNSNISLLLENIENMCETSQDGILVMEYKPEIVIYDSAETWFCVDNNANKIYFEFWDDEVIGLSVDINTIKSIKFGKLGEFTVSNIYLQNGQEIMIYTI